jgi:NADH-quinone oxidoreductase subunit C
MSEEATSNGPQEPAIVSELREKNQAWVIAATEALGETTIVVPREYIVDICQFLKTSPKQEYKLLADLCGADRGVEEAPRFEVNYHLCSIRHKKRLRLKVLVGEENAHIPSVTSVWRTANWHERETYDLVGVIFDGHPDLRRILMPDDTVGHPLRKDYP